MFAIKFKILVFFKDEDALKQYIERFPNLVEEQFLKMRTRNERLYDNGHIELRCIKGLSENFHGCRAHVAAVQEDLTWRDNWHEIRKCILEPMLISPIPVQVFDGV